MKVTCSLSLLVPFWKYVFICYAKYVHSRSDSSLTGGGGADSILLSVSRRPFEHTVPRWLKTLELITRRGSRGGGGAGAGAHPWDVRNPRAPKARVPSSQGQKEGTLVSLEWLFTIQA